MTHSTPQPSEFKTCKTCGLKKSLSEYSRYSSGNRTYYLDCKQCRVEYARRKYYENHEKSLERARISYLKQQKKNPEINRQRVREYYWQNREARLAYQREYALRHKERVSARDAVNSAVRRGELPHVKTLLCVRCAEQATEYHHWSYAEEDWLKVEAMCLTCHGLADYERRKLESQ